MGEPFIFDEWQREDVDLIYELNPDGSRKWRSIVWGLPRGGGKSPCTAGFGLFELTDRQDAPEVYVGAAAREQGETVQEYAHLMPKGGPLEDFLDFPRATGSVIKCPSNGGKMKVLSADGDVAHSKSVSVAIIDELHVFRTRKQEELYFALVTATQKRPDSVVFVITTAGPNKASLLGEKFDAIVKTHELSYSHNGCRMVARNEATGSLMIWWGAPDDAVVSDPRVWRACNPASWIPLSEIGRLAGEVPESVFRRLILNQWVLGADAAIQPAAWDSCYEAGAIPEGADVWIGVDIGERRDHSAVTMVSPMPDGRLRMVAHEWDPAVENVKTLLPMVEAEIRRIAGAYQLRCCAYDKWQFNRSAELLEADGIRMVEVPQNETHMVPGSQLFFDLISQKVIAHDGDTVLRQHVLAAEAKQTSRGGWRFVKPLNASGRRTDESQKVDAALAAVMACAAWSYDNKAGGDLWVL